MPKIRYGVANALYEIEDSNLENLPNELIKDLDVGDVVVLDHHGFGKDAYVVARKDAGNIALVYASENRVETILYKHDYRWFYDKKVVKYILNGGELEGEITNVINQKQRISDVDLFLYDDATNTQLCALSGLTIGNTQEIYDTYKGNAEVIAETLGIPINPITNIGTLNEALNTIITAIWNSGSDTAVDTTAIMVSTACQFQYCGSIYVESVAQKSNFIGYANVQSYQIPIISDITGDYMQATALNIVISGILANAGVHSEVAPKIKLYINGINQ